MSVRLAILAELRAAAQPTESCVTCSDTAVPVTVVRLRPEGLALVDVGGRVEEISVALVEARVGDTVLVHAGEAIAVLPEVAP
ncbi:HypC/HybG/HupF family hydrogenase formation chaperone [Catellatospora sp. KI3]|uniref:HypC/HybG/HupF family hydrogenase formation chaperone n=1 Tax=Catellatospora sp. KI3 TaxID=3041620 RepID=UPI0024826EB6|nr:HypC/HybG/HupF family hydrogenase formation chaperone [Catellatospora sp. KI3]MDI1465667.1 HypC/HybG/HupF family hydrogenase formation chaperone [Catellatospora sp. KI3]